MRTDLLKMYAQFLSEGQAWEILKGLPSQTYGSCKGTGTRPLAWSPNLQNNSPPMILGELEGAGVYACMYVFSLSLSLSVSLMACVAGEHGACIA